MNNMTTLERICPFCGKFYAKEFEISVLAAGYDKYKAGSLIQNAFPTLSASDREFILTGICDECWNSL